MADRLLSKREVAAIWGIHYKTLEQQLKNGTVRVRPSAMVGKRLRWKESEIERDLRTSSISADIRKALTHV